MATLGPVLKAIAGNMGTAITNNPAVVTSTTIALVAQAGLNALAQRYNKQPLNPMMQAAVQITSAALGIGAAHLIGLTVAPEILLVAILAPIVIRYVGAHLFAAPQSPTAGLAKLKADLEAAQRNTMPEGCVAMSQADANRLAQLGNITGQQLGEAQLRTAAAEGSDETARHRITELEAQEVATLQAQVEAGNELPAQLEAANARVAELEAQVEAGKELPAQLEAANARVTKLQEEVAELRGKAPIADAVTAALDSIAPRTPNRRVNMDNLYSKVKGLLPHTE